MEIKCPKCENEFVVVGGAKLMEEQTLWMALNYEGDLMQARTIWEVIKNFEMLMNEAAKDFGSKAKTFIRSISNENKEFKIEFVVISGEPKLTNKLVDGLNAWKDEKLAGE